MVRISTTDSEEPLLHEDAAVSPESIELVETDPCSSVADEDLGAKITSRWTPYHDSAAESPAVAEVIDRYSLGLWSQWFYTKRWQFMYPFQRRVAITNGIWCTLGELFIVPVVLGFILVSVLQFVYAPNASPHQLIGDSSTAPTGALILAFSTAAHNSVWTFLLGLPFERAIAYHKLFSFLAIALGCFHGWVAYYGAYGELQPIPGSSTQRITGFIFETSMIVMLLFAFFPIRRWWFELFYATHWIFGLLASCAGLLHW
jgi:hypothetical protein